DPKVVRRLVVVSAPHPLRLRAALWTTLGQLKAVRHALAFHLPILPERRLTADGGALVARLRKSWSAPGWPPAAVAAVDGQALLIPAAASCALEYSRGFARSEGRPAGFPYAKQMRARIEAPTLQVHGALDPCRLPRTAMGSSRYVAAPYR